MKNEKKHSYHAVAKFSRTYNDLPPRMGLETCWTSIESEDLKMEKNNIKEKKFLHQKKYHERMNNKLSSDRWNIEKVKNQLDN
jgi:hypothetical protein